MPWSPRNCGLFAFLVWHVLAALCIAKHRLYVTWYGALTEPNAMLSARYHAALRGEPDAVSLYSGMLDRLEFMYVKVRRDDRMKDRSHHEAMAEQLGADPAYASELLADVLREGSPAELVILLQQLALAFGAHDQTQHA